MDDWPSDTEIEHFISDRRKKDLELNAKDPVRISAYNPRRTMDWAKHRAAKRVSDLKAWTVSHWCKRGWDVVWLGDSDGRRVPEFGFKKR